MGKTKFKELIDKNGDFIFFEGVGRIDLIKSMSIINFDNNEILSVCELLK